MDAGRRKPVWHLLCVLVASSGPFQAGRGQSKDSSAQPPLSFSGFVDTYFSYNFAEPKTHTNELRNFDVTANEFALSMAEFSVQRSATPVGFRVDLDFGPSNEIVQSGAAGSLANIEQAYATVVVPVGSGLTVDAGKFATHCCYEVIKAKDNFNYSRSFLFAWSVPYYHLGARASYPVMSTLTLNGYVYNGWNGTVTNSGKTFGFEATYAPTSSFSIVGNWLGGPALPDSISRSFRNIYELILTYSATDYLTFVANGIYGVDHPLTGIAQWRGVAGYARYALSDLTALTLRAEAFSDPQGFMTLISQDLREATLTFEYKPLSGLILRSEYRYDWSTAVVFDGAGGPLTRRNQSTLGMGAIVAF